MNTRTRLALIVASPLLAAGLLTAPTLAHAAPSENGGANSNGCNKQLGSEEAGTHAKQRSNPNAHKGVGGDLNFPSNCDHFYNKG